MHLNSNKLITETVLKTHIGTVSFFQDKILGSLSCVSDRMSSNPDFSPKVETKKYQNGRGGKGSVAGSQEILFVCSPKKKYFVSINQKEQLVNEGL